MLSGSILGGTAASIRPCRPAAALLPGLGGRAALQPPRGRPAAPRAQQGGDSPEGGDAPGPAPPAPKPTPAAARAARAAGAPDEAPAPRPRRRRRQPPAPEAVPFTLDNLNPVSMGKKSRAIFDDVWGQLQRIGGPTRSLELDDDTYELAPEEFESPQAPDTLVLVTGATGRVGRVLVRKLLLRGYRVRALVRRRDGAAPVAEAIPQVVEVVEGDVGDYAACRAAVAGVDKVICASAARTALTVDLSRVEHDGVANLARALQDERAARAKAAGGPQPGTSKVAVADFSDEAYHPLWDVDHCGPPEGGGGGGGGFYAAERRRAAQRSRDQAEAYINETDSLVFEGAVFSRDGYAEVGAPLELPHGGSLAGSEGLVLRLLGDAHAYTAVVETAEGRVYNSKFTTRLGWSTVRLPFSGFVPARAGDAPPLDPAAATRLKFRFEPRGKQLDQVTAAGGALYESEEDNRFRLELDWVKALPGGAETDFILVSCAGTRRAGVDDAEREKVVAAKRRGETALRNSGLGYTVVRPGPLAEEAGGYRALVFDQGNRITQPIACADVADVCLKALHDPLARNKTFEVCWEYTPEEGLDNYELVAHLPDKANSYLSPALATLQRNT